MRLFFLGIVLLVSSTTLLSKSYYCTSVNEIINALSSVAQGDEIVIAPGNYENISSNVVSGTSAYFYSNIDGSKSEPIIIRSENRLDMATLSGDSYDRNSVLRIEGDYWIIKDLKISFGQKGLVLDNSNYTNVINCEIYDIGNEAVHIRDGSDYVVLDSLFIYNTGNNIPGYGEGIYVGTDKGSWSKYDPYCWYNTIRNCIIGPNVRAEAFDIKEGTKETVIEYCNVDATGISKEHYADSFVDLKGVKTYVRHNIFNRNNEPNLLKGIAVIDRGVDMSSYDHVIHDNVFNMDSPNGNLVEIYNDSLKIYEWGNKRNPTGDKNNSKHIYTYSPNWYDWEGLLYFRIRTTAINGEVIPIDREYAAKSIIELTADPSDGYVFSNWSGDLTGTNNPSKVMVDADKQITAVFNLSVGMYDSKMSKFNLFNYPNPFIQSTTINYTIDKMSNVRLTVYDYLGKEIKVLVKEVQQIGTYNISFNAFDYDSGIYIYQLQVNAKSVSKHMALIKN